MPAPDYETIYDVESAIEAAAQAVLAGFSVAGFTQHESTSLPVPRVDIQLRLGDERDHFGKNRAGELLSDSWNGTLSFLVVTKHRKPGHAEYNPALHGRIRGKIRLAVQYFQARFTAELLPWHTLSKISHAGSDPACNVEDDTDESALHYAVVIGIRRDAWPELPEPAP